MKGTLLGKYLLVFFALLILLLSGCRKTLVRGYTDINHKNHKIHSVAIQTVGASLTYEDNIDLFARHVFGLHGVKITSYNELLPPTRDYTIAERRAILEQEGIDSILLFALNHSQSKETLIAIYGTNKTVTSTDISVTGNRIQGVASTSSQSVYTPIKSAARNTGGIATLWDWKNANVIWTGNFAISSQGTFHQGDASHAKSAAKGVYIELKNANHLPDRIDQ